MSLAEVSRPFWVSWWDHNEDPAFELHSPWWTSGAVDDARAICAAIMAASAEDAQAKVLACYDEPPTRLKWRFCEERATGWSPYNSRFQRADWHQWGALDGE